jgi:hypothetical protein
MRTEVSLSTLSSIASRLESGSHSLEAVGAAPSGVDAGVMSGFIASLMATLSGSAAGVSEGLGAAAAEVREGAQAYGETDANAQSGFQAYRAAR